MESLQHLVSPLIQLNEILDLLETVGNLILKVLPKNDQNFVTT